MSGLLACKPGFFSIQSAKLYIIQEKNERNYTFSFPLRRVGFKAEAGFGFPARNAWFSGAKRLVFRCETLGFPVRNARLQMGGTFLKCFRGKGPDDSFAKPILEISCFKWNFFSEFPAIFFLKSFAISLFLNAFVAGI